MPASANTTGVSHDRISDNVSDDVINYVRIAHDSICNGLITNAVTTSMMTAFPSQSVMTASVLTLDFAAVVCVNESHCAVVH
jgi:hypothetical protein